jgi:hypothetical protein
MRKIEISKALVLGAAAFVFSAVSALAADLPAPADGYSDLPPPAEGYAAPAPPPAYTAPPVYAAPVYTPPTVYVVPAPVYTAPWVAAPVPRGIYAYAPGYWGGGYWHGWHGHWHGWH